jgi:16S rRNA (cytosine1402-N4)-methyltransferase
MNDKLIGGGQGTGQSSGPLPHQPVLYQEVLDAIKPTSNRVYLDGTLGAGGHAEGILRASAPEGKLLGLDRDPVAIQIAQRRLRPFEERLIIRQASYQQANIILQEIGWCHVHGILLDLGVSSMQIDQGGRGFSFMEDGPLDMRFDQSERTTAEELVNTLDEKALAEILWQYGEERYSRRIAKAIVGRRPILTTGELATVIRQAVPGYEKHLHPATRTFQALRIATNRELETLSGSLDGLVESLHPGGLIAIISFHSLEDRIIKQYFKKESQDCICPSEQPICTCEHHASLKIITKKPMMPTPEEIDQNPRARSARLRVAQKIG